MSVGTCACRRDLGAIARGCPEHDPHGISGVTPTPHPANWLDTRCPDCGVGRAELIPMGKQVGCCICGRVFEVKE